jgi:biopolymer transport protein ExbB
MTNDQLPISMRSSRLLTAMPSAKKNFMRNLVFRSDVPRWSGLTSRRFERVGVNALHLYRSVLRGPVKYLLLGCLVSLTFASPAHAWWNGDWMLRKKITVDTTAAGVAIADPIGTTAVLIRLHDGNFQFANANENGDDLRFVAADDKTLLPYHIEKYDSVLNEAFVWVKVPDLKPGTSTSFWLYYGNRDNKAPKGDDPKGTYDADMALVYHFAGHGVPPSDYTANSNNAQNAGVSADGSMIGGGLRLDGHSAVIMAASPSLAWSDGGEMTWSAWIKPGALQSDAVIYSRRDGATALLIGLDNGIPFVEVTSAKGTQRNSAGAPIAAGSWHHFAVVATSATASAATTSSITLYLDGEAYATVNNPLPALNGPALIGGDASAGDVGFSGEMDELEISKVARPAGFIKLAAVGQGGDDRAAKLLVLGADEQQTNWLSWLSTGYFGIIFKSLSVDGWVVIGLLGVMACLSWFVMINKISYLNGISKGNAVFMKEWRHVATDLTVLDSGDPESARTLGGRVDKSGQTAMRNSSVYRIYHIGVEEIRHRLAADTSAGSSNGRKGLSGRSIQAIRASLDGGLVRETQKINKLIVLLTICISGGPFLGLLGTVVGVMITFAAVAAAGDVNVNAIAPGIAAALLATVAGLAVAIPSLFGYNYIITRVKDATADMHVFIDEFVTKMAEFYRE